MNVRFKDGREVELEIRYQKVTLLAPLENKNCKGDVTVYAISAKAVSPSTVESKLNWRLFTNVKVSDFKQA